ncbi:MAG TPA: redoxin domain-containing protein [Candidatus Angelobacter sp.]|nr:redoxin domain-containing protein [Candidatus Angelobacter sp.]
MRGIQRTLSSLEGLGILPVAISADTPEESREHLIQKANLSYPILSDGKAEAIRHYDLLLPGAGENGRDIGGTAEFLVDPSGTIRWRSLNENGPEKFLEAARSVQ